ncbi:hypothetical protein IU449_27485 [Nocardia higoensis]|uniref:Uncharacterized protein n=1 Tax=Nocardia higoensis TaxID=228599 RepID=A0ABS0DMH4_9NOCA|nr:hypothetical protein [Nocardia higoensis]MBF6358244.1 hypothetical protein [Nocardia higoensis]
MTYTISLAARTTVPAFYGTGVHAPPVPDRSLREVHADVGVSLALAVEAVRARSLGSPPWAAWLLEQAETTLIRSGLDARLYYAELTALHQVLTGREVDEALAEHSWSSVGADYRARAGIRAAAVHVQLREPHPQVLEWLLHLQDRALLPGARRDAVVGAREHLLSYGIDPTDQVVLDELTARRRVGEWVPQHRGQGYFVYGGALSGRTGTYVHPDMTTPLAELLDAATPLTGAEVDLLARARAVDHAVLGPVWVAGVVELLVDWVEHVSVGVR